MNYGRFDPPGTEDGFCGLSGYYNECVICGYAESGVYNEYCRWYHIGEEEGYTVYNCINCGAYKYTKSEYSEKDENCSQTMFTTTQYYLNEELIYEFERTIFTSSHNYERDYILNGESCEDGYSYVGVCTVCGETTEGSELYWHESFATEYYNLSAHGMCGNNNYIYRYSCPCGEYNGVDYYFNSGCSFETTSETYIDDNGVSHEMYYMYCETCDTRIIRDTYWEYSECYDYKYHTYTIEIGGVVVVEDFTYLYSTNTHHFYEYDFTMNGESCEDGYSYVGVCTVCGETTEGSEIYWHNTYRDEYYNLSAHGMCGTNAYIYSYSCPCGYDSGISTNFGGCSWSYTYDYVTDDEGIYHEIRYAYCETCNTTITRDIYWIYGECIDYRYTSYTIVIGEETVVEDMKYLSSTSAHHSYEYEFNMYGESCEDGFDYVGTCSECGDTISEVGIYGHNTFEERVNLTKYGACSGYAIYQFCPCGEYTHFVIDTHGDHSYNEYVDEEGVRQYVTVYACDDCGFRYTNTYHYVDNGDCTRTELHNVIVNVGNYAVMVKTYDSTYVSHNYVAEATLMDGATSCNDGVIVTHTCVDCGESYYNNYYWHYTVELESFDVRDHGGLCEGKVSVIGCACGYSVSINNNTLCDLDHSGEVIWINGYISGSQDTASGSNYFGYDAYKYSCAVTDPEKCGFIYRVANYWLKNDDCSATRYINVQIGYDPDSDTCIAERTYVLYSETYHNYERSDTDNGYTYSCPDCGSYYTHVYESNENGYTTKNQHIYVNTLDDGNTKYREETYEYFGESAGNQSNPMTRQFVHYIYADNSESWYQYEYVTESYEAPFGENAYRTFVHYTNSSGENSTTEQIYTYYMGYSYMLYQECHETNGYWYIHDYTYSFENGCSYTLSFSNSRGEDYVETNSCHHTYTNYITSPTCTQFGEYINHCYVCDLDVGEPTPVAPTCHNWIHMAEDFYYCYDCGLHGIGGASGDVVMEDLTEEYGGGENYVIGYWNRSNVNFIYYVSLILHQPMEDGNDEVVLFDGIDFNFVTDPYVGVWVSIAQVRAAAEAAGYTEDMYDVRIAFVPEGADGSFDYAITFGDLDGAEDIDYTVRDDTYLVEYIGAGEYLYIDVVAEEDATWTFYSKVNSDSYGYLYDAEGNQLEYNDDGGEGNNFYITYNLEAGKTYRLAVRWYSSGSVGYMAIILDKA